MAKIENLYRNLFIQAPEIDGQIIIEESDVEVGQILPSLSPNQPIMTWLLAYRQRKLPENSERIF